jgi:hypothetical protein
MRQGLAHRFFLTTASAIIANGETVNDGPALTSDFDVAPTTTARSAHRMLVMLDGCELVNLIYQVGVGVQTTKAFEIKQVDEHFFAVG